MTQVGVEEPPVGTLCPLVNPVEPAWLQRWCLNEHVERAALFVAGGEPEPDDTLERMRGGVGTGVGVEAQRMG